MHERKGIPDFPSSKGLTKEERLDFLKTSFITLSQLVN